MARTLRRPLGPKAKPPLFQIRSVRPHRQTAQPMTQRHPHGGPSAVCHLTLHKRICVPSNGWLGCTQLISGFRRAFASSNNIPV